MKFRSLFWILTLFALAALNSCIHTAKVKQQFNAGGSLNPTDVVLFTGYNGQDSRTSRHMLTDTKRRLSRCDIEVVYLHDPGLNYEFAKAGFKATDAQVDNDDFIHQLREVFKVSHIISVGSMEQYRGSSMGVDQTEIYTEGSGVVFEVYSLDTETIVASMKVTGKTWQLRRGAEIDSESIGSIHVNYNKALKTLLKSSVCR
ncbi:MAG: hypothetical protein HEP71_00345 [Roseivirga sp.]|nr:hypothetical protein [Roseivirga sp.]